MIHNTTYQCSRTSGLLGITMRTTTVRLQRLGMIRYQKHEDNRCNTDQYHQVILRNLLREFYKIVACTGIDPELMKWRDVDGYNIISKNFYDFYRAISLAGAGKRMNADAAIAAENVWSIIEKILPRELATALNWKTITANKYRFASVTILNLVGMYMIKPYIPNREDSKPKRLTCPIFHGGCIARYLQGRNSESTDRVRLAYATEITTTSNQPELHKIGNFKELATKGYHSSTDQPISQPIVNLQTVLVLLLNDIPFNRGPFVLYQELRHVRYEGDVTKINFPTPNKRNENNKNTKEDDNKSKFDAQDVKVRTAELVCGFQRGEQSDIINRRILKLAKAAGIGSFDTLADARVKAETLLSLPKDFSCDDLNVYLTNLTQSTTGEIKDVVLSNFSIEATLSYTEYIVKIDKTDNLGELSGHHMIEVTAEVYNRLYDKIIKKINIPVNSKGIGKQPWFKKLVHTLSSVLQHKDWICTLGNKTNVTSPTKIYVAQKSVLECIGVSQNPYETLEMKQSQGNQYVD